MKGLQTQQKGMIGKFLEFGTKVAQPFNYILNVGGKVIGFFANLGSQIDETTRKTTELRHNIQQLTGSTGEELDELTSRIQAVAQAYNDDYNEVLRASNALAKQYKISQTEALDLIEKGYVKGANAAGDF